MNPTDRDAVRVAVLDYARLRWCWDDEPFLAEAVAQHYRPGDTPARFVDALARDYGLIDPEGAC